MTGRAAKVITKRRGLRTRLGRVVDEAPQSPRPPEPLRGVFACVINRDPRSHLEALRWFASLTGVVGVAADDLIIYTGVDSSDAVQFLRRSGVHVRQTARPESLRWSGIASALASGGAEAAGLLVLADSDLVFTQDPRSLVLPPRLIASTSATRALPPDDVLSRVFEVARLTRPQFLAHRPPSGPALADGAERGLLLVPSALLPELAGCWDEWTGFLARHTDLPDDDQLALVLAAAAAGIEILQLGEQWHVSLGDATVLQEEADPPAVIHYHDRIEPTGLLMPVGIPAVDEQIRAVNGAVRRLWQEAFPNATFWEWRYRTNPALGSGIGSRGEALAEKRDFLSAVLALLDPASVLDVGCGDAEATRSLPIRHYVGLDLSPEAIRRARRGRPEGDFRVGTLSDHDVQAELTMCLDVLIHQPDRDGYEALVRRLLDSASGALLVSGFERRPTMTSPMVHFHEPLTKTLRRNAPGARIYRMRSHRGGATSLVLKPSPALQPARLGILHIQARFAARRLRGVARRWVGRRALIDQTRAEDRNGRDHLTG
jgi:SAM-dependent methyltransferase